MRRTPLKRSGEPLKRSPLKRSTKPINPVSKKRRREQVLRREFVRTLLEERPRCEAGPIIRQASRTHGCSGLPCDIHEPLTRARGGSILDPNNALAVCRPCHDWIHEHPGLALEIGLLRRA